MAAILTGDEEQPAAQDTRPDVDVGPTEYLGFPLSPPQIEMGIGAYSPTAYATLKATEARLAGYSWDEINGHLSDSADAATAEGYHPAEVNSFLGYAPQGRVTDRLTDDAIGNLSSREDKDPSAGQVNWGKLGENVWDAVLGAGDGLRQAYASALKFGEAGSPKDFATDYAHTLGAPELAKPLEAQLPKPEDVTDYAIAAAHDGGWALTPELVNVVKSSMLDRWAETGKTPQQTAEEAKTDPDLAMWLYSPAQREQLARDQYLGNTVPEDATHPDAIKNVGNEATMLAVSLASPPVGVALAAWGMRDLPAQVERHRDFIAAMKEAGATPEEISEKEKDNPAWNALAQFAIPVAGSAVKHLAPEIAGAMPGLLHDESGQLGPLWHGTPHLFVEEGEGKPFGEFKLSAIGTGEGVQAYGHGLYFAENKGIAEHYRDALGGEERGHLYEVHLPDVEPEHFLDWDKPLSEQSQHVRTAAEKASLSLDEGRDGGEIAPGFKVELAPKTGEDLYRDLAKATSKREASETLAKAGIPGIRYLDAGARDAPSEAEILRLKTSVNENVEHLTQKQAEEKQLREDTRVPADHPTRQYSKDAVRRAQEDVDIAQKRLDDAVNWQPTRNHVIFDPTTIKITGRDGQPAPTPEQAAGEVAGRGTFDWVRELFSNAWHSEEGSGPNPFAQFMRSPADRDFAEKNLEAKARGRTNLLAMMGNVKYDKQMATGLLEGFRKELRPHAKEFEDIVTRRDWKALAAHPMMQMIDQMEQRPGAQPLDPASPLSSFAREAGDVNKSVEGMMRNTPGFNATGGMGYVSDYWRHMWQNKEKAYEMGNSFVSQHEGSIAGFQERTIPYTYHGILQGLVPKHFDAVEHVLHDVFGKLDFLHAQRQRYQARLDEDLVYSHGGPPVPGMIELKGRAAEMVDDEGKILRAYAYPGWANAYNSIVGRGFHDWQNPRWGTYYDKMLQAKNTLTQSSLGVAAYHVYNITKEALMSGISQSIGNFGRLELGRGLLNMGLSATMLPKLAELGYKGRKFEQAYKNPGLYPELDPIVNAGIAANYRFIGRMKEARIGGEELPGWVTMFKQGTVGEELGKNFGRILQGTAADAELSSAARAVKTAGLAAPRLLGAVGTEAGRLLNMVNHSVFEKLVPWMRNGTYLNEMKDFLRRNPTAGDPEINAQASYLSNHVDNKLGELNQDNLFMNRTARQVMNLTPISFGWALGFYRLAGGGLSELASGLKGATTFNRYGNTADLLGANARWLMAYPIGMALTGALYQYMKTGKAPGQYGEAGTPGEEGSWTRIAHNLAYPAGKLLQGYDKDFTKWALALLQPGPLIEKARGALNVAYGSFVNDPLVNVAHDLATGKDWAGRSISAITTALNHGKPAGTLDQLWHIFESNTKPIAWQSLEGAKKSPTPLNLVERISGVRDAPPAVMNPTGYAAMMEKVHAHSLDQTARSLLSEENKKESPDAETLQSLRDAIAEARSHLAAGGGGGAGGSSSPHDNTRGYQTGHTGGHDPGGIVLRGASPALKAQQRAAQNFQTRQFGGAVPAADETTAEQTADQAREDFRARQFGRRPAPRTRRR